MDTRGLANTEVSAVLFPRALQRRTSRPMVTDNDQGYGVNEVAVVLDAAHCSTGRFRGRQMGAALTRPVQLGQLSGQSCSLA